MWNLSGLAIVYFFAVAVAHATPAISAETAALETIIKGQSEVPVTKGRLKFKSSRPVCMCAEGMSERDIQQALTRSKQGGMVETDTGINRSKDASKEQKP